MNLKKLISDSQSFASARVFTSSEEANKFLADHPEYRVVPNAQGIPDTSVSVALVNDAGFVSDAVLFDYVSPNINHNSNTSFYDSWSPYIIKNRDSVGFSEDSVFKDPDVAFPVRVALSDITDLADCVKHDIAELLFEGTLRQHCFRFFRDVESGVTNPLFLKEAPISKNTLPAFYEVYQKRVKSGYSSTLGRDFEAYVRYSYAHQATNALSGFLQSPDIEKIFKKLIKK